MANTVNHHFPTERLLFAFSKIIYVSGCKFGHFTPGNQTGALHQQDSVVFSWRHVNTATLGMKQLSQQIVSESNKIFLKYFKIYVFFKLINNQTSLVPVVILLKPSV